ncbi:MAG: zinc-ribbon domain-containing protein [Caulobacteraceae bacterium]|nr:zinc-ribbon domain-containing protein [Caulobacteraceae bacterium]
MILTCPECATGYFVDDAQIRPEGRTVRCASCGHRWTARPGAEAAQGAAPVAADPESAAEPGADGKLTGDDLPKAFRDRAEESRRLRRAAVNGAVWAGAIVLLAALAGLAAAFRQDVVRAWPAAASAYAALGMPVNVLGLSIEQIHAEPSLQQGRAALAVSGVIRNVEDHPLVAPPLRISLLNAQGRRVAGQIAVLANARIPAGETRHFVTAIFDPPFSAQNLEVAFAVGAKGAVVASAGHAAQAIPSFALRGPAASPAPADANVVEAEPIVPADAAAANVAAR